MIEELGNVVIKLLLSGPGRGWDIRKIIYDDDIFNLPLEMERDGQGWSEPAWERCIKSDIAMVKKTAARGVNKVVGPGGASGSA